MNMTRNDDMNEVLHQFLEKHPQAAFVDLVLPDINGIARGKRIPVDMLAKAFGVGVNLPASIFALDITGATVDATGLVWETGDADHLCRCVPETLQPMPWRSVPSAQILLTMDDDGSGFFADPRAIAQRAVARLKAMGMRPQVAFELEFYLYGLEDGRPRPLAPGGLPDEDTQVYDLDSLDRQQAFFDALHSACASQGLPLEGTVAEYAPGQFEVNLHYRHDALRAADDAWFLKRLIKGVAQSQGCCATFMAKPYPALAGSGMHVHVSLADGQGNNVFARQPAVLRHALGGLLNTLPEGVALFAPHANSYRRFQTASYAPTMPCWGENNRTAALRIPSSEPDALRIEHRFAGADANPYLVLAAILEGIAFGIEAAVEPPPPISGNAYASAEGGPAALPSRWEEALAALAVGERLRPRLGMDFVDVYCAVKQKEMARLAAAYHPLEYGWYLDRA